MTINLCSVPGAVFALWGQPTVADVDNLLNELRLCAQRNGGPIVYVARIPTASPVPSAEVRKHIDRHMTELVGLCASYHAVMEGSGFVAALKRGVLMSMQQIAGRSKLFFVHSTAEEIFEKLERSRAPVVRRLLLVAARNGWLSQDGVTAKAG